MTSDAKVVSFGKWASIIFVFMTATFAFIRLGLEMVMMQKKRDLKGSKVLITNGDSTLSQKLGKQLEATLECQVIYLPKSNIQNLSPAINEIYQKHKNIDVIVQNGHQFLTNPQEEACFTINEGENLVEALNLLKHCIPKMYLTTGGHFVSIKSTESSFRTLIDTRNDFRRYILDLIRDFRRNLPNIELPPVSPDFSMSVIQCNSSWSAQVSEKELVRQISEAIAAQKAVTRLGKGMWKSVQRFLSFFNGMTESSLHLL